LYGTAHLTTGGRGISLGDILNPVPQPIDSTSGGSIGAGSSGSGSTTAGPSNSSAPNNTPTSGTPEEGTIVSIKEHQAKITKLQGDVYRCNIRLVQNPTLINADTLDEVLVEYQIEYNKAITKHPGHKFDGVIQDKTIYKYCQAVNNVKYR
jgi:hypothetical protein